MKTKTKLKRKKLKTKTKTTMQKQQNLSLNESASIQYGAYWCYGSMHFLDKWANPHFSVFL